MEELRFLNQLRGRAIKCAISLDEIIVESQQVEGLLFNPSLISYR